MNEIPTTGGHANNDARAWLFFGKNLLSNVVGYLIVGNTALMWSFLHIVFDNSVNVYTNWSHVLTFVLAIACLYKSLQLARQFSPCADQNKD